MKRIKNFIFVTIVLLSAVSCKKENDNLDVLNNVTPPSNITASFDIAQDNSGLVTILPNADGVSKFRITFGDVANETPTEFAIGEPITHFYSEGSFTVGITAVGITGISASVNKEITVTFKAPENLVVKIVQDAANPKVVTVSATADFATVMDIYFGEILDEEPVHALPGEEVTYTYSEPGTYVIKVVAKSAATATTEYSETITISPASDPVNLPVNFESFTINYAFTNFGNVVSSVVDNPDQSGINTSARVAQSIKSAGAETWGGSFLTLENPIDFSVNKTFKVKVWSPKSGAIVKLKVENLTDGNIAMEVDATTSVSNEWEELSFDFSTIDMNNTYQKIVLFFDFGNTGDGSIYFFDDIKLVPANIPSTQMIENFEGVAPQFTSFGNIANIEVLANPDQSGVNTTATVAQLTKTAGAETWAGAFFEVENVLDLITYSKVSVKTWSPKSGIVVKLKLENQDASIVYEVDVTNNTANSWENLVYDFSGAPLADYVRIVIFFDFGNSGDGSVYYFDEIELANDGGSSTDLIFENFEGVAPAFTSFGNIANIEVLTNPDQSGANTTATVAKLTKTAGAETWAGAFFEMENPLDLITYKKIMVKTWSPKSAIVVKLKLENQDASIVYEVDVTNTTANSWENLVYDFSGAPQADYVRVVIFFDFGNSGDDSIYYFDEFTLTY